jgi:hypothetical protein
VSGRAWLGASVATGVALGAASLWPGRAHAIVAAWAVGMLAWGLMRAVGAVRSLTADVTSGFDRTLADVRRTAARPEDLARCERILGWKNYQARDFDHHVRPLLRTLIEHRLGARGARAALDPELVAVMGSADAETIYGDNVTTADVERVLESIERL